MKFKNRKSSSEPRKGYTTTEIQQRNKKANANYYQDPGGPGAVWKSPSRGDIYK